MKTGKMILAFAYLRLSREEMQACESGSIKNQRMIISDYCRQNDITLVREFVDDGWSGGNFDRPAFQEMLRQLSDGSANTVITKDLSRLGRDMRESSYYAEQFFPENCIRYIAIADNFDTEHDNIMAPFQFAMNEVYLRDGSRKVRDVLKNKRENGLYCACPPYGYRKDGRNKNLLVPDEMTAPVVQRIFRSAAEGDSSRKIALDLNRDGIIPPLKYRVLYRDDFSDEGALRASDVWNYTTVKRILKNRVYLGHTILGRSRKVSVKSKKKVSIPEEDWIVTKNTHEALVTENVFERAQKNLGKGTKRFQDSGQFRNSIFGGIAVCERCGHALCSAGTVYKNERKKYWYLTCTHKRSDISNPCEGVRIRYSDLIEIVRRDLNSLISFTDEEIRVMVEDIIKTRTQGVDAEAAGKQKEKAVARLETINRIITKLYFDNAEGNLDDDRLKAMVSDLETESLGLRKTIEELSGNTGDPAAEIGENYARFFALARKYTHIEVLDRDILQTFVERIEVGPKELPDGVKHQSRKKLEYRQNIRIIYKFIGELQDKQPIGGLPVTDEKAE